ncbi:hypothetical protein LBBP_00782 [Leptospira borgpetersenii serovar Ballum]|uniref:Uncharacterized protein n=1 Tax=Leptospira borgpetersenii serovar Ballum TaxID=280505 RepID=A0A0S2IN90_LEPBO|nr:hypothetical protein LBBP_00782 [Leptospira borgpetersenii serovar Ballum]
MLKNSIIQINKTALIDRFHETETDEELIFQQLYCLFFLIYICGFSSVRESYFMNTRSNRRK